jgi:hypothetical protein
MFLSAKGRRRGPIGPMPLDPEDLPILDEVPEDLTPPTPDLGPRPGLPTLVTRPPTPALAPADLKSQPVSADLQAAKDKLATASAPPTFKQKLLHLAVGLGPMALGGALGGPLGAAVGAGIGGGIARGEATSAADNNKRLLDQVTQLTGQQEREFEADQSERNRLGDAARQGAQHADDVARSDRQHRDTIDALATGKTTTVDGPDGPQVMQWNPDSQRYDIPVGKQVQKPASILRHPVTQEPIGIQRGTKAITDPKLMTPEEQALLQADQKAFKSGLDRQDQRDNAKNDASDARSQRNFKQSLDRAGSENAQKIVSKHYDDALAASERRATMEKDFVKGEAGDAQADMSMLMNHLGMTGGAQKGFRMTEAEIRSAVQSRGLPDDLVVFWKKLSSGERLSSAQRKQMLSLGQDKEAELWQTADNAADLFDVPKPKGRKKVGSGTLNDQVNKSSTPPPAAHIPKYNPQTKRFE